MCGILGFSGRFDAGRLVSANSMQGHRGPDSCGHYFDEAANVGLGFVRLAILDLSELGNQPMPAAEGKLMLVFNGEIYNFRELRRELESEGVRFRGTSDSEVLLQLYLRDGEEMLSRLNGIFAFAIWDQRSQSLLVARDALGVKPVYFTELPEGFAFASEIKALLHLAPQSRELDPDSLHRYLSFLWCPGDGTPLRNVRKVQPGEAMIVRAGRVARRWTWYELPAVRGVRPSLSEPEALAGTVTGLRTAVHRQLVADVPVGAFLSGGLDSSAVVKFAREQATDLQCFSIDLVGGDDAGITGDLPYARSVADHLDVKLHVVSVSASDMASDIEQMITQLDEPLADPAPLNVLYISRLARSHGMKVLLSGAGGDDLFTGYRRHTVLGYEKYWSWIPAGVRRGIAGAFSHLDQRRAVARKLKTLATLASGSGNDRLANYFLWADDSRLRPLYAPEFRASIRERAVDPMLSFLKRIPDSVSPMDRMLALEQRFFLADHNLLYTDKMSMAAGVEVRVPFLDLDLVDFAARIPDGLKQRGKTGKWILKKAMEPYLPHDVIYRPKTGFGAPLRRWTRHELRPLLNDVLSTESLKRRGLFDPAGVHKLMADNESGKIDGAYTILSLLSIELWCRAYVDAVPAMDRAGALA
jgi:asparagine synthase (glutamine-hydrolysing)